MTANRSLRVKACLLLQAVILLLASCASSVSPTIEPTPVEQTAEVMRSLPGGLTLEEHALAGPPALEPLTFTPVEGTQAEIEARHAEQREKRLPTRLTTIDGLPAIRAAWDGRTLTAQVRIADSETQEMTVELWDQERVIFSAPAGYPSPASPLQALWTFDGHWALEILLATPDDWIGQVYLDGRLLNEQYGYEQAFGAQPLGGKLFYFYQQDGEIGIDFDGQDALLGYSQVPHYQCCSGSALNPQQAWEMVAFFAQRDGAWYYVELGEFE
jgi:hypothetical protein